MMVQQAIAARTTRRRPRQIEGRLRSMAGLDRCDETSSLLLHASAVGLDGKGVLLLGRSGRGKSDPALRLIDAGAVLIADDQVRLWRAGDRLIADAPPALAGLIEVRGLGIMRLPHERAGLDLVVDLNRDDEETRLPDPMTASWHGLELPRIALDAEAASAVARIRIALHAERAA
jgi:serine kinase of HPr protein (carbohydrate metabolism regulator)